MHLHLAHINFFFKKGVSWKENVAGKTDLTKVKFTRPVLINIVVILDGMYQSICTPFKQEAWCSK